MNKSFKDQVMDLVYKNNLHLLSAIDVWLSHDANWLIFTAFEYQANAAWAMGYKRYSARTIIEYLRHHTALSDTSADFKINDHVTPDLSRLHMLIHPERTGFFEVRGRRAV